MEHASTCLLTNLLGSILVSSAAISSKAIRKLLRQSFPGKWIPARQQRAQSSRIRPRAVFSRGIRG